MLFSELTAHLGLMYPFILKVKVAQSCLTLCDSMDYTVHGILQARILEWAAFPFSRGSSYAGIEPRSPALQADSSPTEPQGKLRNTGVGSLSLLQQIFPTQEQNQGLLHCRWILYQLSLLEIWILHSLVIQLRSRLTIIAKKSWVFSWL